MRLWRDHPITVLDFDEHGDFSLALDFRFWRVGVFFAGGHGNIDLGPVSFNFWLRNW